MKRPVFLTADWRHLVVLNYEVEPEVVEPYLPPGLEIDFWRGTTYLSLVAFLFQRTRVCGLAIPFHRNFPEVNLRFYVKRSMGDGERRGVVFLREIAPRRAVAYVARRFFGEKYLTLPMRANIQIDAQFQGIARRARFEWQLGEAPYAIEAAASGLPRYPAAESLEEFIIEHYWGYSDADSRACVEYEVEHPRWLVRSADRAVFCGDAKLLYGPELGEVLARPPELAFLADGSAVAVRRGTRVTESPRSAVPAMRPPGVPFVAAIQNKAL